MIVGSILLAFAIDAAWDNHGQEQRRDALHVAIRNDMQRARIEVDRVATFHRTGRSATAEILGLNGMALEPDDTLKVDSLVAAAWGSTASYDAPLGAVESLFGAGALELLTDPDLAFELTAFPSQVADLGREQLLLQGAANDLHTYLGTRGVDVSLFDLGWIDQPWATGHAGTSRVVSLPGFRGLVSLLWIKYSNTTAGLEEMREAIARIESLLPRT